MNVDNNSVRNEAAEIAVAKKRSGRKDVLILAVIVLLTVLLLTAFTVMRTQALRIGEEDAFDRGVAVFEETEDGSYESDVLYGAPSTEKKKDDLWAGCKDYYYDGEGNFIIEYYDGTKFVGKAENHVVKTVDLTWEDLGIDIDAIPEDPVQANNTALRLMEDAAYAGNSPTNSYNFGATQCYSANTQYNSSSYSATGTCSCGSNSSDSCSCRVNINLAGILPTMKSRLGSQFTFSYVTQNGSGGVSGNQVYFTNSASCSAGCGGSSSNSCTAQGYAYIKHTYTTQPSVSWGGYSGWTGSRAYSATASDSKLYVRRFNLTYVSNTSGGTNAVGGASYDTSSVTLSTGTDYGWVRAETYNWNGSNYSQTRTAWDLYLDRGAINITQTPRFSLGRNSTAISAQTSQATLYCYFQVQDTPGDSYAAASGISSISLKNNTTNNTYTAVKNSSGTAIGLPTGYNSSVGSNGAATNFWIDVAGSGANGSWTLTVADRAGHSKTANFSFEYWDATKPSVSNVSVTAPDAQYKPNSTATASAPFWTNKSLSISFRANDTSSSYSSPYRAGIRKVVLSYKVNGVAKSHNVYGETTDWANTISKQATSGTTRYVDLTVSKIMYDYTTMTDFTITVTDYTGNSVTATTSSGISSVSVLGRLDTVAPNINSLSASAGTSVYTAGDIGINVNVIDYSATGVGAYFGVTGGKYNNGSGTKNLYFYSDASCSTQVKVNGTSSNVYQVTTAFGNTNGISVAASNLTVRTDSAYSTFKGNLYVVAEDWVGNKTSGYIPSGVLSATEQESATYQVAPSYLKSGYANNKVWLYPGGGAFKITGLKRDTFKPQIELTTGSGASGTVVANTAGVSGTSKSYTFEWKNASSLTFYARVWYGSSGGTLHVKKDGVDVVSCTTQTAYTPGNAVTGFNNVTLTTSQPTSAYNSSMSTSGAESLGAWKYYDQTIVLSGQGTNTYTIYFQNTANNTKSAELTVTVRLDNTPPSVKLLGFLMNGSSTVTSEAGIASLLAESNLLNSSQWLYPNSTSGYRMVFEVTDTGGSGIPTAGSETRSYGVDGSGKTQTTSSYSRSFEGIDGAAWSSSTVGYRVQWWYSKDNNATDPDYQGAWTGFPGKVGNRYLVQIQFFSRTQHTSMNKSTGWDVKTGTYLRYKVGIADFMGNVGYYTYSSTQTQSLPNSGSISATRWNNRVLRYYVDPFPVTMDTVSAWQVKSDDTTVSTSLIPNGVSAIANTYEMSLSRDDGWAKRTIIFDTVVHAGLSGYTAEGKYKDLTSLYATKTTLNPATDIVGYDNLPNTLNTTKVLKSGDHVWIVFDATSSKNVQVGIGAYSAAYQDNTLTQSGATLSVGTSASKQSPGKLTSLGTIAKPLIVKQDREAPRVEYFFLSVENTYDAANSARMLTFDTTVNSEGKYTMTLNTEQSPWYNSAKTFIYSDAKVYVYIGVHDKPGNLLGSGVSLVKFGANNAQKQDVSTDLGVVEIWRSYTSYGYDSIDTSSVATWTVTATDKQQNSVSFTYGHEDKNGYKMFPVIDSCDPYVRIAATSTSGYLVSGSGSGAVGNILYDPSVAKYPIGTTETTENKTSSRLKGTVTGDDSFTLTIDYSVGISGLSVYIRRKSYASYEAADWGRLSTFSYFDNGKKIAAGYDYSANGWGIYEGETWKEGKCYSVSYESQASAHGRQESKQITINLKLKSFKEAIEILAVSGTGKYYIIDAKQLFIDTEAPVIHDKSTFFSVASSADDAATIDYSSLQRIWTNVVGTDYTNGNVYIYFFIADGASGVNDDKVLYGTKKLQKVKVSNVPVWKVNGVFTMARVLSDTVPTAVNVGGMMYFNDPATSGNYAVYRMPEFTQSGEMSVNSEPISYVASPTIVKATTTLTLYRLCVEGVNEYSITAKDNVPETKRTAASASHIPAIDKTAVSLTIGGRTSSTDTNFTGYTGATFTNKDVTLRFDTRFGVSGFGGIHIVVWDNLPTSSTYTNTTTTDLKIPQINKIGGKITFTVVPRNATTASVITSVNWPSTNGGSFKLRVVSVGGTPYWQIDTGATQNVATLNESVYGSASVLSKYTWTVYENQILCTFDVAKVNKIDAYTVTAYNAIKQEFAVNRVRPSKTATFTVKMDVDAPVIDFNSGNVPEIANVIASVMNNQTVYSLSVKTTEWHALAKALRVRVTDALSGIGKTGRMLDSTTPVENVMLYTSITYPQNDPSLGWNAGESWTMVKDADNLYRPYELNLSGNYYTRAGLGYLTENQLYKLVVYDEAGNSAQMEITPQIDATPATITSMTLTDASGNPYLGTNVSVQWINDINNTVKVNWTGGSVFATFTVKYGKSGFRLQYKRSAQASAVAINAGSDALAWNDLTVGAELTRIGAEVPNGDGTYTSTVRLEIGQNVDWLYYYYRFRVLSGAQYTERYVYKSFTDASKARAEELGTQFAVTLEAYEASDKLRDKETINLSAHKDSDVIAIDRIVPTVGFSLQKHDGQNANGTDKYVDLGSKTSATNWTVPDGVWSKTNARMALTLSSSTDFASGNVIYYRSSNDGTTWTQWTMINPVNGNVYQKNESGKWVSKGTMSSDILSRSTGQKKVSIGNQDLKISDSVKAVTYTLNDSQNNVLYEFYTENGAGNVSDVIHFGTKEANHRYGIKVDTSVSQITPVASSTFTKYATASVSTIVGNATTQASLKAEYGRTQVSSGYVVTADSTFTYKNSVIVNLQIGSIGYSGINLYVKTGNGERVKVDTITYDQYVSEKGNGSTISRYYYVNSNGLTTQTIHAESIAGISAEDKNVYVRIDNTTPILYVSGISGTRASNWGWTNNLYTDEAEYWYVSELDVSFGVGVVENGSFVSRNPYSGYTMKYRVKGTDNWMPINDGVMTIEGLSAPVVGDQYEFCVTSGAGLTYYLGQDVLDNKLTPKTGSDGKDYLSTEECSVIYSADGSDTTVKSGDTLNAEIRTRSGVTPIKAHVGGAVDDGSYEYVFYVDSKTYTYSYEARLDLGNGSFDTDSAFVSYTSAKATGVSGANFTFTATTGTEFHRGDVIRVTYASNWKNVATSAGAYDYYQSYTVSKAGDRTVYHAIGNNVSGLFAIGDVDAANEKAGTVTVQFEGNYISIVAYFLAEVDVTYGDVEFYRQVQAGQTTGAATYAYSDGGVNKNVNVSLAYAYYDYNDFAGAESLIETVEDLGAYYVISSVTPGTGFFRVTEATKKQEFVVKYFEEDGAAPLNVNNATDFTFVDGGYYNMTTVLGRKVIDRAKKTYLDSSFVLTADIETGYTLTGTYTGTFDGGDHVVTTTTETITGNYGLFDTITGKVANMTVRAGDVTVDAGTAATIGLLAKAVNGGTVDGVSVIADVTIERLANGGVFGGIVGSATAAKIGQYERSFTDVRITNDGAELNGVSVSTVAGYAVIGSSFNNLYVFGEIELYNVTNTYAGIVFGKASGAGIFGTDSVTYLDTNVFVNGSTVGGASNFATARLRDDAYIAASFDTFVSYGSLTAGGTVVATEILTRLYDDFGYVFGTDEVGTGTAGDPLQIRTAAQIKAINGYMNTHFAIATESVDMSAYDNSVAVTKVFHGSLTAIAALRYARLTNLSGNATTTEQPLFGLFGQLNGSVSKIIFDEINVDLTYEGTEDLYVGLVAAKAYADATVVNVMMIGAVTVTANAKAIVGGVVGYARGTSFNDVFNVANMSVTAGAAYLGGVAGQANAIELPSTVGAAFILGRAEVHGAQNTVGSVVGALTGGLVGGSAARTYAIENNVYDNGMMLSVKPFGGDTPAYNVQTVNFDDSGMRTASFASVGGSAFDVAFGYYPIASGTGSTLDPFIVNTEEDFRNINLMLYANYRVSANITFSDFKTIGEGLVFSGVLKGYVGEDISAENGKIISLIGVTGPLVYYNSGSISELSVNVEYSATVQSGETFRYGAIAVYSDGEIKNVTVAGSVEITSEAQDTTLYVSGFVAESFGGAVEGDVSKLQNSISALNINVNGGGTAYVGGYAGSVTRGSAIFSYGIATGTINVTGVYTTYAGLLVGRSTGVCEWILGEAASIDYTYTISIDGLEIPKYDENDEPLTENFCGLSFISTE